MNLRKVGINMENNRYGLYYNHKTIGDVLLIEFKPNEYPTRVEKHDNVVALYDNDDLVGINVFNISDIIKIKADGFIHHLNNDVTDVLNLLLTSKGLKPLPYLKDSGFRIAKIVDIEEHPDSDHLHICKVDIGEEEPLQIVCGAFNARLDLKCVCALPYTFMPDGKQIVPGKLMKVESFGMLCSGRELGLKGYENIHGLLEINDDSLKVGDDFFIDYKG